MLFITKISNTKYEIVFFLKTKILPVVSLLVRLTSKHKNASQITYFWQTDIFSISPLVTKCVATTPKYGIK